jgi:hypothetical protein
MNELEVLDPQIHQTTQIAMRERRLGEAPQPAVTAAPRNTNDFTPVQGTYAYEWPVRFIPRVEIFIGAVDNFVNSVVETVKEYEEDGQTYSLLRPLSLAKNGIAIKPLTALYDMLKGMEATNYVFLAADDEQINARADALLKQIQKQLVDSFAGVAFEAPGEEYAISRSDFYTTSVAISNKVSQTASHQTVNDVELIVSVYVHAAGLTDSSAKLSDVSASYAKVVRNLMKATGIETSLDIVFDVANFKTRPSVLELFNALCADDISASVQAVTHAEHLPASANIGVSINLTKKL